MLHRLRKGRVNDSRTKLPDVVEADETLIGGPVNPMRGRGVIRGPSTSVVVGAVPSVSYTDQHGESRAKAGRLRLARIDHADEAMIGSVLREHVEPGAGSRSDGWRGYSIMALKGFQHDQRLVGNPGRAPLVAPHIHRVFANLNTWLIGTHHGVEPRDWPNELDAFVFRFNRRHTPMAAFQTVRGLASGKKPVTRAQ